MAIGSDPVIGENFSKPWGKLSEKEKLEWFAFMEEHWHPNLLNGYAKIIEKR